MLITLLETAADLTTPVVNGITGVSFIGSLVWGIGKMTAVFERMQENDQKRTDATINSVNMIAAKISDREEARTNAAIGKIEAQATILSELAKGQATGMTQLITTQNSARDQLHELRNLTTDVAAQKRYESEGKSL